MGQLPCVYLRPWSKSRVQWIASKKLTLVSALTIALVAIVTYLPALRIGFLDGWWYLHWAATMNLPRYLIQFFDPANITQGYRPVQGLYIYLLYHLVGFNPDGYHIAHTLLHAANGVLLFAIVWRLGKEWHIAFIAALFYVSSPVYNLAVFWHAVVDPLAAFFYLLTILLWIRYQETGRRLYWAATFGAYLLALLSKELSFFLTLVLFLIERWLFGKKSSLSLFVRQYGPFIIALFPYLVLVSNVQSHGEFVGQFGLSIGFHIISNMFPYLAVLAFPWTTELPSHPLSYFWLGAVVLLYLAIMLYKRSKVLLLLAIVAVLNISPLLGFPIVYFNTRYLYFSMMVSSIVLALLFENSRNVLGKRLGYAPAACTALALLILGNGFGVANAASELAEYTRQLRVPFRDIARQHQSFPEDTYLYFIYSPRTPLVDLQGLFMVRYGTNLQVSGTEIYRPAGLHDRKTAFVYYFDEADRPHEIVVDKSNAPRASTTLPVDFDAPIRLEGLEIVNETIKRGDPLILLLYWKATSTIDKDYTVFAHLVDASGRSVLEFDSQPRRGTTPTSEWKDNQFIVDAVVLPTNSEETARGNYRLEIGLYDRRTMQRLSIIDQRGLTVTDKIVIEGIAMVE